MPIYEPCSGRLSNTVAAVTGSTHGIGLAIARRFAHEGATLVINDHGEFDGSAIASELRGIGNGAIYVEADMGDPGAIERFVRRAADEFHRIDVLVNNVARKGGTSVADADLDEWERSMDISLRSHWLCTKHAMEHMPDGGSVINISSVHADAMNPGLFPYNVAKAGVNGLTRALAIELGPLGIRANAIMPGSIDARNPFASDDELRQEEVVDPAGRTGRPADVAGLAAYLAADESQFVTGVSIPVDGGRGAVLHDAHHARWWAEQ